MRRIELLAPAGNREIGMAAVDHGADAVYIAGPRFGARHAAGNPTREIARLVDYCRPFGVRVYAALNTLIYDNELEEAERSARELIDAGVDALIIQDTAFLRMGLTGVEFHASTQMCNQNPEHIEFLGQVGFTRAILERSLSLEEIRKIASRTDIDLECFVHGAICVGHSGRCYLSRAMSERSGNRGTCTQACRLSYDLSDAAGNKLMEGKYLLSVKDMNLSGRLEDMIDAGANSFKIEGRLKEAPYVKNIVAHYRLLLDEIIRNRKDLVKSSAGEIRFGFVPDPSRTYSRDQTTWMLDCKKPGTANFETPKAMGKPVGVVRTVTERHFNISLFNDAVLAPGDGLCFITDEGLCGTVVNRVDGEKVYPREFKDLRAGQVVYRNFDHAFNKIMAGSTAERKILVDASLLIEQGSISLLLTDSDGISITETIQNIYDGAQNPEKSMETIRAQIKKCGNTIFNIKDVLLNYYCDQIPFIPVSVLNSLRRSAVEKLLEKRCRIIPLRELKTEKKDYPYTAPYQPGTLNITNSLASGFYADHGVKDAPLELSDSLVGANVMTSSYCIRRETGRCLKDFPASREELYLIRGRRKIRLDFDCGRCEMKLTYLGENSTENETT